MESHKIRKFELGHDSLLGLPTLTIRVGFSCDFCYSSNSGEFTVGMIEKALGVVVVFSDCDLDHGNGCTGGENDGGYLVANFHSVPHYVPGLIAANTVPA